MTGEQVHARRCGIGAGAGAPLLPEYVVPRPRLTSAIGRGVERGLLLVAGGAGTGKTIAVASDAGTPLLSDPGFVLVREAAAKGIRVEPIPGASAILTALVASGLPPHPFTFAGFPPPKSGKRRTFYKTWAPLGHTLILFESPHRLLPSLEDALAEMGDRPAAIGRELTKMHEEVLRGKVSELLEELKKRPSLKGEFVVVVGAEPSPAS